MTAVLRLGHRPERDKRISTHVCLTARAFGADEVIFSNRDEGLFETVRSVVSRFGGEFALSHVEHWRRLVKGYEGPVVHLTMYGVPVSGAVASIKEMGEPLIIVGAEKVPRDVYEMADFNVSVGNQPHSEVAALAILLDRLDPTWEMLDFGGSAEVLPAKHGKRSTKIKAVPGVPDREECLSLLERADVPDEVLGHVVAVERRALRWGAMCGADLALLRAGALLHDIGRSKGHGIEHGFLGYRLLREWGVEEMVARFALVHVGAGIPAGEAERHGMPRTDMTPRSLEEKIVAHADNLTRGARRGRLADVLSSLHEKGEHDAVSRMLTLHREIEDALGMPPECA